MDDCALKRYGALLKIVSQLQVQLVKLGVEKEGQEGDGREGRR